MTRVAEINNMPNGQIINSFVGTVTYVNDPKTFSGQYGETTSQRVQFADADGGKIQVELTGKHATLTMNDKGKTYIIKSRPTPSHGLQGIKVAVNGEYHNLRVTGNAEFAEYHNGQSTGTSHQNTGGGNAAPQQQERRVDARELAEQMGEFTCMFHETLINKGLDPKIAAAAASRAPEYAALWWFGAKGLEFPTNQTPPATAADPSDNGDDDIPF